MADILNLKSSYELVHSTGSLLFLSAPLVGQVVVAGETAKGNIVKLRYGSGPTSLELDTGEGGDTKFVALEDYASSLIDMALLCQNEDIKEAATKAVFKCFLKPGLTELAKKLFMEEKCHTTVAASHYRANPQHGRSSLQANSAIFRVLGWCEQRHWIQKVL